MCIRFVHLVAFPVAGVNAVNTVESKYAHLFRVIESAEELQDIKPLESLQCSWEFANYAVAYSKTHNCRLETKIKHLRNCLVIFEK